jgi:hypothetical protein
MSGCACVCVCFFMFDSSKQFCVRGKYLIVTTSPALYKDKRREGSDISGTIVDLYLLR